MLYYSILNIKILKITYTKHNSNSLPVKTLSTKKIQKHCNSNCSLDIANRICWLNHIWDDHRIKNKSERLLSLSSVYFFLTHPIHSWRMFTFAQFPHIFQGLPLKSRKLAKMFKYNLFRCHLMVICWECSCIINMQMSSQSRLNLLICQYTSAVYGCKTNSILKSVAMAWFNDLTTISWVPVAAHNYCVLHLILMETCAESRVATCLVF